MPIPDVRPAGRDRSRPASDAITLPLRLPDPLRRPYRAVVLDMDGLLVDTEELWTQAKVEIFGRYGSTVTTEDRLAVLGTSEAFTSAYMARRLGFPPDAAPRLRDEYLEIVRRLFATDVRSRPGAVELVARLSGRVPLGLASNTRRELVDVALRAVELERSFDAIATADEVEHGKPAPDLYLLACERLGVAPAEAIALEDSATGMEAARAAGLTCIGVPSDAEIDVSAADAVVASLLELLMDDDGDAPGRAARP